MGHDQRWPHASRCGRANTMNRNYRRRLAVTSVLAIAISGGVWIARSDAGGGPKTYTSVASPTALHTTPTPIGITLTNTSRNKISFNAINLSIPAGLTISGTPTLASSSGGTLTFDGTTIALRDLSTPQGGVLTVNLRASAPLQATCVTYTFSSDVRQSNDFNGLNNKFALDGADATVSGPCRSTTFYCSATDNAPCATGLIESTNGNSASVFVDDSAAPVDATLTADFTGATFSCAHATVEPTSDPLHFEIDVTGGTLATGAKKTVTFTQPAVPGRFGWQYQICFQGPDDFPALNPDPVAFAEDFATNDFSGNTTFAAGSPGTYSGLLLPCSSGHGIPCVVGVPVVNTFGTTATTDDIVTVTIDVPAGDPGMRF